MEDMDIDIVVEVPDTPDRLAARHSNRWNCVGKESNSSVADNSVSSGFMDEECPNQARGRTMLVNENGRGRRLCVRPRKNFSNINETDHHSSPIVLSPLENSYASQNGHSLRRISIHNNPNREAGLPFRAHLGRGKAVCTEFPSKPSTHQGEKAISDLAEQNDTTRLLEMAFPCGTSKDLRANGGPTLNCVPNSSKVSGTAYKGKEKSNEKTYKGPYFHSVASPRVGGKKRLVRNGCISPHNIAIRAKGLDERESNSFKEIESNNTANMVSNVLPCLTDISDIVAEENTHNRVKGKGIIVHPFTSKEHDATKINNFRSPVIINEENSGTRNANRDAFECAEGLNGWRSMRSQSKNIHLPLSDAAGCLPGKNDGVGWSVNQHPENRVEKRGNESGRKNNAEGDYPEDKDVSQTASRIVSQSDQSDRMCRPLHAANTNIKRKMKHALNLRNLGECSTLFSDDSEILFLGSSEESSNSRSTRIQCGQHQGIRNPVIDVDELSPEMRHRNSQNLARLDIDESDSRARQVEADEMLARELQEQLYHEVPVVGGGEIDEHIARTLQLEEDAFRDSSNRNHRPSLPRASSISHSYRQPQSQIFQNHSNRRATQGRVPTPARMAHLRSRLLRQSPTVSSRERNHRFPLDMDRDMGLDILEALEDTDGDHSNLRRARHILQVQRDFNENDYEMLLALDEDNHLHVSTSINQINRLPQSTVQNENYEDCAICLETPTNGETIRHLPCLHKFHKDCIDPWLRRRTSCPVCKSSIA